MLDVLAAGKPGKEAHSAMAFLVERPIEVIARMCIPIAITARVHDEYLALARAPDPHRQPKISPVSDRHRVKRMGPKADVSGQVSCDILP
jgi:hypothetical protein